MSNIEDACGEYRRPLSSLRDLCRGTLPKKIKEHTLKKLCNFKVESIKKYFENLRTSFKNGPENLKNRGLEGVWELLGAILRRKNVQEAVLADLGQFWTGAGCPKWRQDGRTWRQDGAKMGPRWPKMGLVWPSCGRLGSYLGHFGTSWGRSLQKWPKCKNERHYGVLATNWGVGGSGWRLLGLSWGILATSWTILGDLGVKMGPSWQHVGPKMAKMSQDRRTWRANGWL